MTAFEGETWDLRPFQRVVSARATTSGKAKFCAALHAEKEAREGLVEPLEGAALQVHRNRRQLGILAWTARQA